MGLYGSIYPEFAIEYSRHERRPRFPSEKLGEKYAAALNKWLSQVDMDSGYDFAKKVIEAMRLFATGDVGTSLYMNLFPGGGNETGNPDDLRSGGIGDQFVISRENRRALAAFWTEYAGWKHTQISRHLGRFLRAYAQDDWYDRLVDFVTSMEGLVLAETRHELRNQFSLRIAWLLGSRRNEREQLFEEARNIYDLRSKVVHGDVKKESETELRLCKDAEELNRRLLVLALKNPELLRKERLAKVALGI